MESLSGSVTIAGGESWDFREKDVQIGAGSTNYKNVSKPIVLF
ncbi:hypothetical protein [Peribacillus phoenicis]